MVVVIQFQLCALFPSFHDMAEQDDFTYMYFYFYLREHPANSERSYGNFLVHFESCNDNLVGCIDGDPVGGALHPGGGEGAPVRLSPAPQGAVQTLLVVLLLDRVPVYVRDDAE